MKKVKKFLLLALLLLVIFLVLAIAFSPYRANSGSRKSVQTSVVIEAPAEFAFNYLGNSENAKIWSVFVDHIRTLNGNDVPDGAVGSIRRCFVNANETGTQWDEEILDVVQNKYRKLSIFNMQNFSMTAENIETEQVYKSLSVGRCELAFNFFFKESPKFLDELKMYIAAYRVKSIFVKNLENIKKDVEMKYRRSREIETK